MTKGEAIKIISEIGDKLLEDIESLKRIYLNKQRPEHLRLRAFSIAFEKNMQVISLMSLSLKIDAINQREFEPGGISVYPNYK